ncbi:hypothetical protein M0811_11490 [Anaeramoeba ignava]|uniref:UDENN FLCN/SMCR8-type domain-containing protein n=1 Tax=Anaeramoeba ignava TaxID=1746090 RepID=A0A9Q0LBU7_ANAIG|nr:hypothetical protein M0811_11490 [Anaeramoeba ignava]
MANPITGDFIIFSEFCQKKGPSVIFTYPKKNNSQLEELVIQVMSTEHQQTRLGEPTKDASFVIKSRIEHRVYYVYAYHFTLYDINARAFLRRLCFSYATRSHDKIMRCILDFLREFSEMTKIIKLYNLVVFLKNLENRIADIRSTLEMRKQMLQSNTQSKYPKIPISLIQDYLRDSSQIKKRIYKSLNNEQAREIVKIMSYSAEMNQLLQDKEKTDQILSSIHVSKMLKKIIEEENIRNYTPKLFQLSRLDSVLQPIDSICYPEIFEEVINVKIKEIHNNYSKKLFQIRSDMELAIPKSPKCFVLKIGDLEINNFHSNLFEIDNSAIKNFPKMTPENIFLFNEKKTGICRTSLLGLYPQQEMPSNSFEDDIVDESNLSNQLDFDLTDFSSENLNIKDYPNQFELVTDIYSDQKSPVLNGNSEDRNENTQKNQFNPIHQKILFEKNQSSNKNNNNNSNEDSVKFSDSENLSKEDSNSKIENQEIDLAKVNDEHNLYGSFYRDRTEYEELEKDYTNVFSRNPFESLSNEDLKKHLIQSLNQENLTSKIDTIWKNPNNFPHYKNWETKFQMHNLLYSVLTGRILENPIKPADLKTLKICGLSLDTEISPQILPFVSVMDLLNKNFLGPNYPFENSNLISRLLSPHKNYFSNVFRVSYMHQILFEFSIKAFLYYQTQETRNQKKFAKKFNFADVSIFDKKILLYFCDVIKKQKYNEVFELKEFPSFHIDFSTEK